MALEELLREGARRPLQEGIENEVHEYIEQHGAMRDEGDKRLVVRNGHLPEREIITGVGRVRIEQPRVNDRRRGE